MTMTTNPLDTLSVKLIAPYTKAEDSVLGPISSAVKDKLVIGFSFINLCILELHVHFY